MKQTTSPTLVRRLRVGAAFVVASLIAMLLTVPVAAQEPTDPTPTPTETVDTPTPEPTESPDPTPTPEPTESAPALPPDDAEEIEEETPPTPDEPIRFVAGDEELPDWGFPYMLSRKPFFTAKVDDLKNSPEPSCPAPPLPTATEPGSGAGYTMPLRLKLSNGVMLAGYSDAAHRLGQETPFSIQMAGLTGWITARVSLPSLRVEIEPTDVQLCGTDSFTKAFQAFSRTQLDPTNWSPSYVQIQPDGTEFIPIPGSMALTLGSLNDMRLRDFVAQQVKARITGVEADGSLSLTTELKSTQTISNAHRTPGDATDDTVCPGVEIDGTFGTDPKQIVTAEPPPEGTFTMTDTFSGAQRNYTPAMPARQSKAYLPGRTLSGAVEGGSVTVGSNWFDVMAPQGECRSEVHQQFYGYGDDGTANFKTYIEDWDNFEWWWLDPAPDAPYPRGLTDLSLDVTVDKVGLPKYADVPTDYGFEE